MTWRFHSGHVRKCNWHWREYVKIQSSNNQFLVQCQWQATVRYGRPAVET